MMIGQAKITLAQQGESRLKIQLSIDRGGKKIVTELTSVSTSIARYGEEATKAIPLNPKDTLSARANLSSPVYNSGQLYFSMDSQKFGDELLQVFAKKTGTFDGVITVVDAYNKLPTRTIAFRQASLTSYSDQVSAGIYGDSYGAASVSISCKTLSINNILIEQ